MTNEKRQVIDGIMEMVYDIIEDSVAGGISNKSLEREFRLQRILDELSDLMVRMIKLQSFMKTDEFNSFDDKDKDIFKAQLDGMTDYRNSIISRLDKELY